MWKPGDRVLRLGEEGKPGIDQGLQPLLSVKALAGCREGRSLHRGRKGKKRPALSLEGGEVTTEGIE